MYVGETNRPCGKEVWVSFMKVISYWRRRVRPDAASNARAGGPRFRVDAFDGEFSEMVNVALHNLDCEGDCLGCCVQMRDQCVLHGHIAAATCMP